MNKILPPDCLPLVHPSTKKMQFCIHTLCALALNLGYASAADANFSWTAYEPNPNLDCCQRPTPNSTIAPLCACYVQVATAERGPLAIIDCSNRGLTSIPLTIPSALPFEALNEDTMKKESGFAEISYIWLQGNAFTNVTTGEPYLKPCIIFIIMLTPPSPKHRIIRKHFKLG